MTYSQVKTHLIQQASRQRIPLVGEFELTPQCNLNCTMCYIREAKPKNLVSTEAWIQLIHEAKEAGLLFCLFTGGEIFLRDDFQAIYEATYDLGIRITLFTNGTLITDDVIAMLKKRPPELLAITMYGVTPELYQAVTGHPEAFAQVGAGIRKLQEAHLPFLVRTIAVREIYNHLDDVLAYFKAHHFSVSYSLYVGPRRCNVTKSPDDRLTPPELVCYDKWFQEAFGVKTVTRREECYVGLSCVAGASSFFVSWDGAMMPCAMLNVPKIPITNFNATWNKFQVETASIPLCSSYPHCEVKSTCMQCAAKRYLEGGFTACSPYLKEIATLMRDEQ